MQGPVQSRLGCSGDKAQSAGSEGFWRPTEVALNGAAIGTAKRKVPHFSRIQLPRQDDSRAGGEFVANVCLPKPGCSSGPTGKKCLRTGDVTGVEVAVETAARTASWMRSWLCADGAARRGPRRTVSRRICHLSRPGPFPQQAADRLMQVVLAYLLIGSYALALCEWRKRRTATPSRPSRPPTPSGPGEQGVAVVRAKGAGSATRRLSGGSALLLTLRFLSGSIDAHAERYVEISAQIETSVYPSGDTNDAASVKRGAISLVCVAGTNTWRIDNDFAQGAEVRWFFDGTNVYDSIRATRPAPTEARDRVAKKLGVATAPFEVARSNVTIRIAEASGGAPLGDVGVNIPWLAFCSGTYLKRAGRVVPLPVAILRHCPDGFAYSDRTETFPDELGLPRTLDLITSRSLYEASISRFGKDHYITRSGEGAQRVTSGLQDGLLKFHYAVTESTNFLGWNLPVKFEFLEYDPGRDGNLVPHYGGVGRVTSIRASTEPENIFAPSMQQTIVDWRFRSDAKAVEALLYRSTNAFAATTNDPALQRRFAARVARVSSLRPALRSHAKPVVVVLALVFIAVSIPLAFIILRDKKILNQ